MKRRNNRSPQPSPTPPNVRIHKQPRRSLVMKLTPIGVVVFIPDWMDECHPQVQAFIAEALTKLNPPELSAEIITPPDDLRALVAQWARVIGVQPKRITLREMYRKWGSCSGRGNITLNSALCRAPRPLAEYVVVHELVHLRELNHGPGFKALMMQHLPDWRERERALDQWMFHQHPGD